ncbi:MFS transporter [Steroidobacter flavus]|uniref:MFS transporter n=1 Tax=Steroidobacter flavus TaxID=1842136 RepID=A0ABV8T6G1_9GAMM
MDTHKSAAAEWRRFGFLPLAAALGYATSVLHVYSLGAFIGPLQHEFGWSRAQISVGLTVAALISAIGCIPVGMLVDRIGPRRVGLIGVVAMSAALACASTATGTPANWLALWGVIAIGTFFVQATVWTSAVASRFEASRGLAFAITLSGASLAATLYPILATWLIGNYGWRTAYAAMGGIWVVLVFPILFFLFRGAHDQGRKEQAAAAPVVLTGVSFAEGLRSAALYKLLMAAGLFSFTVIGVAVHFVPILTDSGATPLSAAGIASLVGIFSIVGRLGTGFLLDRYPGHIVGAMAFLIPIVACVLLLTDGANPVSQAVAAAIFGLTLGSEVDVIAYLAAKHFGLKNFGALYGVLQMALAGGTAFGPLAAGAVFDRYHSYSLFLVLTAALMAASAIALFTLGPVRQAAALDSSGAAADA